MDTRDPSTPSRPNHAVTLQLSSGALLAITLVLVVIGVLAVAGAFMAGIALQRQSAPAPAVTVITLAEPTAAAAAPAAAPASEPYPAPAAPEAQAATAAPAEPAPAAAPTSNAPVFDPVRPTSAQERGFGAPDAAPTPADFQLAPSGAQPAPTVLPAPAVVAPVQIVPAPAAAPAAAPVAPLPTDEPSVPTAQPPLSAAANPRSGGDAGGSGAAPPARPVAHSIKGTVTWTAAKGPIILKGDVEVTRGASLIIGEGVELQIPRGAAIVVHGNLYVLGSSARPVRITQAAGDRSLRWEAIYARPGSAVALNYVDLSGGGAGGTLIGAELSDIKIRSSRIFYNGGQIRLNDSRLEMRDSEMRDNEMPYGAAVDVTLPRGGSVTLVGNRIFANRLTTGTAPVLIVNQSFQYAATLEVTGNLLVGQDGPNLQLFTNAQMQGNVTCNTLTGGSNGLSLRSDAPPTLSPILNLRDNAIENHTPPIIDIYLEFGIGRGATSDLPLGMANNWWEVTSGPYEPDRNNGGRGEAVGDTITFAPWLTQRPGCAPRP